MAKPTEAQQEQRWDNQVKAAIASGDMELLEKLSEQGLSVQDVILWIWDNSHAARKEALKLMIDKDFMKLARGR